MATIAVQTRSGRRPDRTGVERRLRGEDPAFEPDALTPSSRIRSTMTEPDLRLALTTLGAQSRILFSQAVGWG